MENSILIRDFIEQIWNNKAFEKLDSFLHAEFRDYSLPPALPTDRQGTKSWIVNTGISFEHHTIIEDQVTENDKCIVKIRMKLKHVGVWRDIEPSGLNIDAVGYRYFKIKDGKIIGHWGLIDGQAIENQLQRSNRGCKIAE